MADSPAPGERVNIISGDILPLDTDADYADPEENQGAPQFEVPSGGFLYDGRGMTPDEFTTHLQSYNFGSIPPDFIVLHHTAIPSTAYTWPDIGQGPQWDAGEAGLSEDQIKEKRKRSLDGLRNYYANQLGWNVGPHLFVDDRYIWLFTPMYNPGIHAKWGNKFYSGGKMHYSIGIEVVGYYEKRQWPPAVQRLVRHAVTTLQQKLNTFTLEYLYSHGGPGMVGTGDNQRCGHPEQLRWGGISSHRDYNKPQCPGAAITEDFYMKVIRGEI